MESVYHPVPWPYNLLISQRRGRVAPPRNSQDAANLTPAQRQLQQVQSSRPSTASSAASSPTTAITIPTAPVAVEEAPAALSPSPPNAFPPDSTKPELHVRLSLPRARYDAAAAAGLRLKLTVRLAPHLDRPISFSRRGTIFDSRCPLLGRGGFFGIADASRRPVKTEAGEKDSRPRICTREHSEDGAGLMEFGDNFITIQPGEETVVEKVLPAADLARLERGRAYTIYSRPDREKKKPARVSRAKWGTREDVAESAFWCEEGDEKWVLVDVSHVVRDRDWMDGGVTVLVGNSVRFAVV